MTSLTRVDARAVALLEQMGWTVREAFVDVDLGRMRLELSSFDGLLVTLDVRRDRASVTREDVAEDVTAVGRRGDKFLARRLRYTFLGRQRFEGIEVAFRWLSVYLADNSPRRELAQAAVLLLRGGA